MENSFGRRLKHGWNALQGGTFQRFLKAFRLSGLGILALGAGTVLSGCGSQSTTVVPPASEADLAIGRETFESVCAQCHGNGQGDTVNPPLIGSKVLAAPPIETINIILQGQSGKSVVKGIMPAQASLRDSEIANVVAYVRATFANQSEAIAPEMVAKARLDGQ